MERTTLTTNAAQKLLLANRRLSGTLNKHEVKGRGMAALRNNDLLDDEGRITLFGQEVARALTVRDTRTGQPKLDLNATSTRYGGTPAIVRDHIFMIEVL